MQRFRKVGLARIEVWRVRPKRLAEPILGVAGHEAEEAPGLDVHEMAAKARLGEGTLLGVESVPVTPDFDTTTDGDIGWEMYFRLELFVVGSQRSRMLAPCHLPLSFSSTGAKVRVNHARPERD